LDEARDLTKGVLEAKIYFANTIIGITSLFPNVQKYEKEFMKEREKDRKKFKEALEKELEQLKKMEEDKSNLDRSQNQAVMNAVEL
jgi:hypothetical protein